MKKRDVENLVEALIHDAGLDVDYRHGANHDKYIVNGRPVPIPRHTEIGEQLVREILKQAGNAIGGGDA